jgi:hypothetical protein
MYYHHRSELVLVLGVGLVVVELVGLRLLACYQLGRLYQMDRHRLTDQHYYQW